MYGLPSTVGVDQRLPKEAFYKRLKLSSAVKDEFVRGIDELRVVASIKQKSCGIAGGERVQEIMVLRVALKTGELPLAALDAIASANPNKLVFACTHEERVRLVVRRDRLYAGEWQTEDNIELALAGATLDEVWDALCSQAVFQDNAGATVDERIKAERRRAELTQKVDQLRRWHAKEAQPAKRNALFKQLRQAQAELSEF